MGRGAQDQTRQLTDQQLANINSLNQQFFGQQQQVAICSCHSFKIF